MQAKRTLIFSDTHLTHHFDQELFDYISKLLKDVDQVIINGDFWDAYLTTFDYFIDSEWKKLFPLLKKKKTVYVFGNHDKKKFMDERVNLFSEKQVDFFEFKSGRRKFYVTHGHLIAPTFDNKLFFRNPTFVRWSYRLMKFLVASADFFKKILKLIEDRENVWQVRTLRDFAQKHKANNQFFVFGHSHLPLIKISENFINLGELQSGSKSYCIINENGYIELFK